MCLILYASALVCPAFNGIPLLSVGIKAIKLDLNGVSIQWLDVRKTEGVMGTTLGWVSRLAILKGDYHFVRSDELVWVGARLSQFAVDQPVQLIVAPQGCIYRKRAISWLNTMGIPWRIV